MKFLRTNHHRYTFRPAQDFTVKLTSMSGRLGHHGMYIIHGHDGGVLAVLERDCLAISHTYWFDGCTCAPDPKAALKGCCIHDALLQILRTYGDVFPVQWAHDAMLEVQQQCGFRWAKFYHWAVSGFPRKIYKLFNR